jgi:hypothetical protein
MHLNGDYSDIVKIVVFFALFGGAGWCFLKYKQGRMK